MTRVLAFACSWIGGGIGWWFGSMIATWFGLLLSLIGFAAGTYVGIELVRRFRP